MQQAVADLGDPGVPGPGPEDDDGDGDESDDEPEPSTPQEAEEGSSLEISRAAFLMSSWLLRNRYSCWPLAWPGGLSLRSPKCTQPYSYIVGRASAAAPLTAK